MATLSTGAQSLEADGVDDWRRTRGATRIWEFAIDALDVEKVRAFGCAVLGYQMVGDSDLTLIRLLRT